MKSLVLLMIVETVADVKLQSHYSSFTRHIYRSGGRINGSPIDDSFKNGDGSNFTTKGYFLILMSFSPAVAQNIGTLIIWYFPPESMTQKPRCHSRFSPVLRFAKPDSVILFLPSMVNCFEITSLGLRVKAGWFEKGVVISNVRGPVAFILPT